MSVYEQIDKMTGMSNEKKELLKELAIRIQTQNINEQMPSLELTEKQQQTLRDGNILEDEELFNLLKNHLKHIITTVEFYDLRAIISYAFEKTGYVSKESRNPTRKIEEEKEAKIKRNQIMSLLIQGNPKLELLQDWTIFNETIGDARNTFKKKLRNSEEKGILSEEFIRSFEFNKVEVIINYLQQKEHFNPECFFETQKLIGRSDLHRFESTFAFINALTESDFAIDILYFALTAFDITGQDLLEVSKIVETQIVRKMAALKEAENDKERYRYTQLSNSYAKAQRYSGQTSSPTSNEDIKRFYLKK